MSTVRGRIAVHPRGFGFLVHGDGGRHSAFVPPPDLNRFLDGDIVDAELSVDEAGRQSARALELRERSRSQLFGTIVTRQRRLFLRADRLVSNTDWPIADPPPGVPLEGCYAVAEIRGGEVRLVRLLADDADLSLERCLARHGLHGEFPEAVLAAAANPPPADLRGRRDLTALPTVTIDAPVTQDLDDALAVLPAGGDGALRVFVSIADVADQVPAGSPLDEEARRRGTSVYLAGRVLPMLPEAISTASASLLPGAVRPAVTVELRLDAEGQVTAVDLYASLIRSHARLSYDGVAGFLERGEDPEVPVALAPTLRWLRTAAARLSAVRAARGGVQLSREEAYVALDASTGEPLSVEPRLDTPAHQMVERLMVAANEAVAGWLVARGLPGVFRVHDEPAADRVAMLATFAHHFGLEAGFAPRLSPRGLAAFEAQLAGSRVAPAIRTVLTWTLGPARYTTVPSLHFGLAAPLYLHFTSPIRRYADLSVHRVVKRFLAGERAFEGLGGELAGLAEHLNHRALVASRGEAERHRMLVARLFAGRVGEEVAGNVIAVKPFGLVLQIVGTGATGTIALEALGDGGAEVDLAGQSVVTAHRRYTVGDALTTRIAGTSEELGRVDLVPVD